MTLQADIDLLQRWSKMWLLKFHPDKHRYGIYGNELDHVFEEKDLGITMDSELSFEEHVSLKA